VSQRITLTDCPKCKATGKVDSRLPFRKQVCPECGDSGRVTPTKRVKLIKRLERGARDM
jgi:DnaJ-class molecular chaperone